MLSHETEPNVHGDLLSHRPYKSLIVDQQGRIAARGNYLSPDDEVVIATIPLLDRPALRALYEHCKRPDLY